MLQIIEDQPSFAQQLGKGAGEAAGSFAGGFGMGALEGREQKKVNETIKRLTGKDLSGLPVDIQKQFLETFVKTQQRKELINSVRQGGGQMNQTGEGEESPQQMQRGKQKAQDPFAEAEAFAAAGEPELMRVSLERGKEESKGRREDVARGYEESKPTRTRGRELLEDLPYKENALLTMKDSIQSGNLGAFSWDNVAELTGIEGLRSPEGASFKTASKEFFLGNLSRVGAKGLNQMMEKVVQEMSPVIGRSTEANLAVSEVMEAETDVTRKEAELIHDIGQAYKENTGHYPDDLQDRVYKELRPYARRRQQDAISEINRIKQLYEPKNKQGILMYDPSGSLRRVPHQSKKEALKEGYRMP